MSASKPEPDRRFSKFGVISFTATSQVNHFIDCLEQGVLAGTKCVTCGSRFFPPRAHCHKCLDKAVMEWFQVQGAGRLLTYSLLQYAPVGFESQLPYAIAVADYGDYKVFGRIKDLPPDGLPVGTRLKAEIVRLDGGNLIYEFVPLP